MEDQLAAANRRVHALIALDVALDELDLSVEIGEIPPVTRGEVVEDSHLTTIAEQPLDEVRADEAAATRDQDLARRHPGEASATESAAAKAMLRAL